MFDNHVVKLKCQQNDCLNAMFSVGRTHTIPILEHYANLHFIFYYFGVRQPNRGIAAIIRGGSFPSCIDIRVENNDFYRIRLKPRRKRRKNTSCNPSLRCFFYSMLSAVENATFWLIDSKTITFPNSNFTSFLKRDGLHRWRKTWRNIHT